MAEALARISQIDGLGMIQIRADLDRAGDAIAGAAGLAIPARGATTSDGSRRLGWMSPDELLLVLPRAELAPALAALTDALARIDALEPAITPEAQRLLMDAHFHLSTAVAPYQPELQAGAKEKIA